MRHRPSTERHVQDARWFKDKRGNWRYKIEQVSEVEFCYRVSQEPEGFYNGAQIRRV